MVLNLFGWRAQFGKLDLSADISDLGFKLDLSSFPRPDSVFPALKYSWPFLAHSPFFHRVADHFLPFFLLFLHCDPRRVLEGTKSIHISCSKRPSTFLRPSAGTFYPAYSSLRKPDTQNETNFHLNVIVLEVLFLLNIYQLFQRSSVLVQQYHIYHRKVKFKHFFH